MDLIKQYLEDHKLNEKIRLTKFKKRIYRISKVVAIIIIIFAVLLTFRRMIIFLKFTDIFKTANIIVEGNRSLKYEEVLKAGEIDNVKNIFQIDLKRVRNLLLNHPRIKEVTIKRKLPDTIIINIEERIPTAIILVSSEYISKVYEVDNEGYIISEGSKILNYDLPIITGVTNKDITVGLKIKEKFILKLLDFIYKMNYNFIGFEKFIGELNLSYSVEGEELRLILNRWNIPVYLGSELVLEKLEKVLQLLGMVKEKILKIEYINFKGKDIVIKWRS